MIEYDEFGDPIGYNVYTAYDDDDSNITYISDEDYDWLCDLLADEAYDCIEINLDDPMYSSDYCKE